MGVAEITDELQELARRIKDYLEILGSRERIMGTVSYTHLDVYKRQR